MGVSTVIVDGFVILPRSRRNQVMLSSALRRSATSPDHILDEFRIFESPAR